MAEGTRLRACLAEAQGEAEAHAQRATEAATTLRAEREAAGQARRQQAAANHPLAACGSGSEAEDLRVEVAALRAAVAETRARADQLELIRRRNLQRIAELKEAMKAASASAAGAAAPAPGPEPRVGQQAAVLQAREVELSSLRQHDRQLAGQLEVALAAVARLEGAAAEGRRREQALRQALDEREEAREQQEQLIHALAQQEHQLTDAAHALAVALSDTEEELQRRQQELASLQQAASEAAAAHAAEVSALRERAEAASAPGQQAAEQAQQAQQAHDAWYSPLSLMPRQDGRPEDDAAPAASPAAPAAMPEAEAAASARVSALEGELAESQANLRQALDAVHAREEEVRAVWDEAEASAAAARAERERGAALEGQLVQLRQEMQAAEQVRHVLW